MAPCGRAVTLWCYLLCCLVNITTAAAAPSGLAKSFHEENFLCDADDGFVNRCVPKWQEECRNSYAHNPELQTQLCETHLNRNYVKIRTLVGEQDILQQWKWDKARRDYDVGFFRSHFPKFTPTGVSHLKMPADLHSKMKLWLDRNRHSTRPESSQPAFGINCNTGSVLRLLLVALLRQGFVQATTTMTGSCLLPPSPQRTGRPFRLCSAGFKSS